MKKLMNARELKNMLIPNRFMDLILSDVISLTENHLMHHSTRKPFKENLMKKQLFVLAFVLSAVISAPNAHAENIWDMAESDQYGKKFAGMLGRGLINAASCFVDIPVHIVRETQEGPPLVGTLTGIGSGAACTVLRAGSGIIDVAGSWVPGFNGLPVSRSYENCMDVDSSYGGSRGTSGSSSSMPRAAAKAPSRSSVSGGSPVAHDPNEYIKK